MRAGGKTEEQTRPWLFAELDRCKTEQGWRGGSVYTPTLPANAQTTSPGRRGDRTQVACGRGGWRVQARGRQAEEGGGSRQEDDRPTAGTGDSGRQRGRPSAEEAAPSFSNCFSEGWLYRHLLCTRSFLACSYLNSSVVFHVRFCVEFSLHVTAFQRQKTPPKFALFENVRK